jgi:hypothetical protein
MRARTLVLAIFVFCASGLWAQRVSVPAGANLSVRVNEDLSSERAQVGDRFTGVLEQPLVANGLTVFPRGTNVSGRLMHVKSSGRLKAPGELGLQVTSIGSSSVQTEPFYVKGQSHTKNNVTKIGGGAAAGAIIGGITGGGKGAAIGAAVGAGAGTGLAAATGKKPAEIQSEAVVNFTTARSFTTNSGYQSVRGDNWNSNSDSYRGREDNGNRSDWRRGHDRDDDNDREGRADYGRIGDRERDILRGCLSGYNYQSLPPGIQKKLARGGTLPPGHAKKMSRGLPGVCMARLPRVPNGVERIIFGDRVILLGTGSRILDWFILGT